MPKSLPNSTVKVKRATAARWASQNPVLAAGEIGYETDTRKMKLGDGTSSWTQLSYLVADGTGAGGGSGGQAATIRIGTVTTLRYNQNATVVNSGTSTAVQAEGHGGGDFEHSFYRRFGYLFHGDHAIHGEPVFYGFRGWGGKAGRIFLYGRKGVGHHLYEPRA